MPGLTCLQIVRSLGQAPAPRISASPPAQQAPSCGKPGQEYQGQIPGQEGEHLWLVEGEVTDDTQVSIVTNGVARQSSGLGGGRGYYWTYIELEGPMVSRGQWIREQ